MDTGADHRPGEQQRSTAQESRSKLEAAASGQAAAGDCFDCNICLDFAVEPVVTLCGHLYCWPCIYKWLRLESATPQQCPVCKAALSPSTLVPLYGRGCKDVHGDHDVPRRPSTTFTAGSEPPAEMMAQQVHHYQRLNHHHHHRRQHGDYTVSSASTTAHLLPPLPPPPPPPTTTTMLGGTAIAVLPWVLGDDWMRLYHSGWQHLIGGNNSPRLRRQEMQDRTSLHRISVFFFCCVVLCLLVF